LIDSPFKLVTSILESTTPIEWTDEAEKAYVPFLTNKALSYNNDTLPYAVEINQYKDIPSDMQYSYLFHSVRKFKRPRTPWHKPVSNEDVATVGQYYNCNPKKAADILRGTTDDQLNTMRQMLEKGGAKK
jgi:hypothetical protein